MVVITFVVDGDTLVTPIDHKPKTTTRLQRIVNIETNPRASVLIDHYSDDWDKLWWVRVDGPARIESDSQTLQGAVAALADKYPQYREHPPIGQFIVVDIEKVRSWTSSR